MSPNITIALAGVFHFFSVLSVCWLYRRFSRLGDASAGIAISYGVAFPNLILFSISFLLAANYFYQLSVFSLVAISCLIAAILLFLSFKMLFSRRYAQFVCSVVILSALYFILGSAMNWVLTGVGGLLVNAIATQIYRYRNDKRE